MRFKFGLFLVAIVCVIFAVAAVSVVGGLTFKPITDPGSPVEGQTWYSAANHALSVYNGTTTIRLGAGGGGTPASRTYWHWLPSAGCNGATASPAWDLPTTNAPNPGNANGTLTVRCELEYADGSVAQSAQVNFQLPANFVGTTATVPVNIIWSTPATTGGVKFFVSTMCMPANGLALIDNTFNTASGATGTAPSVANRIQTSSISALTITGPSSCDPSDMMYLKIVRDPTDASDTIADIVRIYGISIGLPENY